MKLELSVMAGPESKAFLVDFSKLLDRAEKLLNKTAGAATDDEEETDASEADAADEDEDFGKKPAPKKKAAAFDEEEEDDVTPAAKKAAKKAAASFDEEEEEDAPAPAKKAKKITLDDVNDACKARARSTGGKEGRAEVLALLKKKFKTESVSELKPEQYAACVALMEG